MEGFITYITMSILQFIEGFRKMSGFQSRTPPVAVIAGGLMNDAGQVAAYAQKGTGILVNGAGVPLANSITTQIAYSANGAISVAPQTAVITKTGSLAAMTLALPTTAQNGTRITITSATAFAHTITCPSAIINRGVTGDPVTVITLAAFPGGGVTLEAYSGKWQVVDNVLSTFA